MLFLKSRRFVFIEMTSNFRIVIYHWPSKVSVMKLPEQIIVFTHCNSSSLIFRFNASKQCKGLFSKTSYLTFETRSRFPLIPIFPIPAVNALSSCTAANMRSRPNTAVVRFMAGFACSPAQKLWSTKILVVTFSSILCSIDRVHLEKLFQWAEISPLFTDILF